MKQALIVALLACLTLQESSTEPAARKKEYPWMTVSTWNGKHDAFLKRAKAAGVKFSFGTNNGDPNIGRLEYPLQMVQECGLKWQDIFVPKPAGEKPVQRKGMPKYMG